MNKNKQFLNASIFFLVTLLVALSFSCVPEVPPDSAVTEKTINGLASPILGQEPDTSIENTDQYSVTSVSWSPNDSVFEAEKIYTATIKLKAKNTYTFSGVGKNTFSVAGASTSNPAGTGKELTVTAVFPLTAPVTVTDFTIEGLTAPVVGEEPDLDISDNDQFSATINWNPVLSDGTFKGETIYKATIVLEAKTGYTFDGVDEATNKFSLASATSVTNPAGNSKTITVKAEFPETAKEPPEPVTHTIISGVTPPVVGQTPAVAATDGTEGEQQFSATINWSPELSLNGKFKGETVYTATISLSANTGDPGYTFSGVGASLFGNDSVSGASTVSFNTETFVVTAVFPLTAPATVTDFTIEGLTPPAVSQAPDTSIPESDEYSVTSVSWNPSDNPFKGEAVYTATIILEAKTGYTFDGVDEATNKFSLASATSVTNPAGNSKTLTVTAVFPETDAATISANTINGLSVPELGGTPVIIDDLSFGNNTECSITGLSWSPSDNSFKGEVQYIATINISSKEGYTFKEASANLFTVSGASELSFQNMSSNGKDIQLAVKFPLTDPATVTNLTIEGLTAPAVSQTPDTSIPDSDEYSVTSVNWNPSDNPFKGEAVYTATIVLEAKTGYTFNEVTENSFSLSGATSVTNPAGNSKTITVTAEFPETEMIDLKNLTITGITAPESSQVPDTNINSSEFYSFAGISWNPDHDTYLADKIYTAEITLIAKKGYIFNGAITDTYNVEGATNISYGGERNKEITIYADFPRTQYYIGYKETRTIKGVSFNMICAADPYSQDGFTIPTRNDDSGTPENITSKYMIAETEFTNDLLVVALNYGLEKKYINNDHFFYRYYIDGNSIKSSKYDPPMQLIEFDVNDDIEDNDYYGVIYNAEDNLFEVKPGYEKQPVLSMSLFLTASICNWLTYIRDDGNVDNYSTSTDYANKRVGVIESKNGYRMPSRLEWECSARYLGTTQPTATPLANECILIDGYYWTPGDYASGATAYVGEDFDHTTSVPINSEVAWYFDNSTVDGENMPHNVAQKAPNALGLYDMSGNAKEWTASEFGTTGKYIYKGGSFEDANMHLKIGTHYLSSEPDYLFFMGFRLAQSIILEEDQ